MYLSKYASTSETTNLGRVARMILGPCTDVLRAVLTNEMSPSALSHNVKTFIANYPKFKKCSISKEQENLIHGKIYKNFDISLLYIILRNICQVPDHKEGWGNVPLPTDRSVSANIERIRLIRNEYGHSSEFSVSDTEFKRRWQDILKIVQELESCLSLSTEIQNDVIFISTCSMDPEQESNYIRQLLDLDKKIQGISEETKRVENACVPKNVRVLYERDLANWKKDDSLFVETHNFPEMLEQVRKQTYVTFVGVPGSGKTVIVRHIALILEKEGYQILPIKDIKDIENLCDPDNPQVFIIDDVLGVFGLDLTELNKLKKYQDRISEPIMSKTKTLMTCREAVFRNEILRKAHFISREKHLVQLSDDANALTTEDRRELLVRYNLEVYVFPVKRMLETSKMFPILCKLFSQQEELKFYGSHFFKSPVPCILNEVEQMKTENKMQYVSLVLLMTNQNKLSEEDLENEDSDINIFSEIKYEVLKKCKVKSTTDTFEFIDALSEMEGTYTKKCGNLFTFEHDSMFEIIAYHFGSKYPELILRVMSSDYIANYIKIDTCTSEKEKEDKAEHRRCTCIKDAINDVKQEGVTDLCIKLKEAHYPILCERLVRDIQTKGYHYIFINRTLNHFPVLQRFIGLMGADVNMMHANERPLTAACSLGILNVVEELIKAGADVNLSDGKVTPLTAACEGAHLHVVENLIKARADVNLRDEMFTPLTLACEKGQLNVVEMLIKAGADVNLCDEHKTPLTIACEQGHLNIVAVLIQSGANVNMSDGINTPLTIACEEEQTNAVKRKMEIGKDVHMI